MKVMDLLYDGNIHPAEQVVSRNPEYRKVSRAADERMIELEKELSKEQYNKIDKLYDLFAEANDIQNKEFFSYGVAFGILLIQETMGAIQLYSQKGEE